MAQTRSRFPWNRNTNNIDQEDLISNQNIEDGETGHNNDIDQSGSPQLDSSNKPVVYTSQFATLVITVNVTIGVGLLAMPFAMQTAGVVTSMLMQSLFVAFIVITCIMCVELTVKSDVKSYHEIIRMHCPNWIYQFTQVSILMIVFGATVAYIVTVGDQADRVFATLFGPTFCKSWYMSRRFIMSSVTLVAIKPLCSARTVNFLKYASFLGLVSIGFIFYVVFKEYINTSKIAKDVNYYPQSWSDITTVLPVFCLAYQCHLSLVPTIATIRRSEKPRAFVTASVAMIISWVIYSVISILAVLTFGGKIQHDLTESYPGKSWDTLTTIAIVGLKCVLTLPAAFLPARLSIIDLLTNNWNWYAQLSETVKRVSVTVLFLDAALLMATLVPNILVAVNLLGCLAVMLIFTLPGLAYLSLTDVNRVQKQVAAGLENAQVPIYTARDKMKRITCYFMITFGSIMTMVVLYKSISEMLTSGPAGVPLCHD